MLRPLYPSQPIAVADRDAETIVIPGIGMPRPRDWTIVSSNWLQQLSIDCAQRMQVMEYEYTVTPSTGKSYLEQLADESHVFLSSLDSQWIGRTAKRYPVIFICHSLGGLVLKEAFSVIRRNPYQYRNVSDRVAAIIFLGTPHVGASNSTLHSNLVETIIRTTQSRAPPKFALRSNDNDVLRQTSHEFYLASGDIPVLSAYDGKESKVSRNIFAKYLAPKSQQVMNQNLCKTGARYEQTVAIDSTHNDLCKLGTDGSFYTRIRELLTTTIQSAVQSNAENHHIFVTRGLETLSLRSRSSFDAGRLAVIAINNDDDASPSTPSSQTPGGNNTSGHAVAGSSTQASIDISALAAVGEVSRRMARIPCFALRSRERNTRFYGQTDILTEIDTFLLPGQSPPVRTDNSISIAPHRQSAALKSFAICGIGGSGKTEIAVEYAYSRKEKYHAILWVSADNENILKEDFAKLAVELNLLDPSDVQDLPAACELVKGWLSNPTRTDEASSPPVTSDVNWLLIFDNADKLAILDDFWPREGVGSVLVTSRDSLAKSQTYAANQGVDLAPLSVDEASHLIGELVPDSLSNGQEQYVREIARTLGGLPILITQMAGVISRLRISCKDFLRLCEENDLEHIDWTGTAVSRTAQVFKISTKMGFDGLDRHSLALLHMMSLLDPDGVPEKVLEKAWTARVIVDFPHNLNEFFTARAQLQESSLIACNTSNGNIILHRIVQDVARANMTAVQMEQIFTATLQAVSDTWPHGTLVDRYSTDRYEECARMFPSVLRIREVQEKLLAIRPSREPDTAAALFNDAGWYWFERGFPDEAKEFWHVTELLYNRPDLPATQQQEYMLRRANLNAATASMEANDGRDCLRRYKIWLEDSLSQVTNPNDVDFGYELACIYNETGVGYAMNGDYDTAIDYFIKSIEAFQQLSNYDDIMLNWPQPNLGLMYWVKGEYDDAERILLEILQVHEARWGVDDRVTFKTGKILYALGSVYTSKADFPLGLTYHTRALAQFRATLGENHTRVGAALHKVAEHLMRAQEYQKAEEYIRKALKIFGSRPYLKNEFARTKFKHGQLQEAVGDLSASEVSFNEAFGIFRVLRPDDRRQRAQLTETDFDELVIFWSR